MSKLTKYRNRWFMASWYGTLLCLLITLFTSWNNPYHVVLAFFAIASSGMMVVIFKDANETTAPPK